MKRNAFTMIELIFVIVILGILAAVAIPKLSATRDDAKATNELASVNTVIKNLGSEYTSQGDFVNYTVANANDDLNCFSVSDSGSGTISVSISTGADCPSKLHDRVKTVSSENGILNSDGSSKDYIFGGSRVVW